MTSSKETRELLDSLTDRYQKSNTEAFRIFSGYLNEHHYKARTGVTEEMKNFANFDLNLAELTKQGLQMELATAIKDNVQYKEHTPGQISPYHEFEADVVIIPRRHLENMVYAMMDVYLIESGLKPE
jgi:hypothetical protein